MSVLEFSRLTSRERCGLKGPRAAEWLGARGIELPPAPNSWARLPVAADVVVAARGGTSADAVAGTGAGAGASALVARLGASEFFLEGAAGSAVLRSVAAALRAQPQSPGVYPVLREDAGFLLSGDGMHDVLAQVCNVNFAALPLAANPVIMTLMIGVAVLVIPGVAGSLSAMGLPSAAAAPGMAGSQGMAGSTRSAGSGIEGRCYWIWCDPTFAGYLEHEVGTIVIECGGNARGIAA